MEFKVPKKIDLVTPLSPTHRSEQELLRIAQIMSAVLPPNVAGKLIPSDAELFAVQFTAAILPRLMENEVASERLFWREVARGFAREAVYGPNGPLS